MKTKLPLHNLLPKLSEDTRERLGQYADADLVRKGIAQPMESVLPGERAVVRYISTRGIDRDSEILVPEGAVIDEYMKNPVVLFGHNYSMPPHAKAEWVKADDRGLQSKTVYAETDAGEEMWQLVSGGYLNAASVGFVPLEYVVNGGPGWAETTKKLGRKWDMAPESFAGVNAIYNKWLLLEYSDVPIPANPEALVQRAKSMGISDGLLKELGLGNTTTQAGDYAKACKAQSIRVVGFAPVVTQSSAIDIKSIVAEVIATAQGRV